MKVLHALLLSLFVVQLTFGQEAPALQQAADALR